MAVMATKNFCSGSAYKRSRLHLTDQRERDAQEDAQADDGYDRVKQWSGNQTATQAETLQQVGE